MNISDIVNYIFKKGIAPSDIIRYETIDEFKGNPPFLFHTEIDHEPTEDETCDGFVYLCDMSIIEAANSIKDFPQIYHFLANLVFPFYISSKNSIDSLIVLFSVLHEIGHWNDHTYTNNRKPYRNRQEYKEIEKRYSQEGGDFVRISREYRLEQVADKFALEKMKIMLT